MNITKLEQWRQNPQLVAWAGKVMNSAEWELLMKIMERGEHVRHFVSNGEDATRKLGRVEGWDMYSNTLALAASPVEIVGPIEVTFAPPETAAPETPEQK